LPYGGDDVVAVFLWLLKYVRGCIHSAYPSRQVFLCDGRRLSGSEHYFPFAAADLAIAQDRMQLEALCRTACHFVGVIHNSSSVFPMLIPFVPDCPRR
jgi:hypothetical protein